MNRSNSTHDRPKSDLYADVTNKIIAAIESGTATFSLPWQSVPGLPKNVASNRSYRGINTLLLWLIGNAKGYTAPYWATFNQWRELGHCVRAGEKSATVVFWKQLGERGAESSDSADEGNAGDNRRPILARAYHVFNAAQVEGFTLPEITPLSEAERDAKAEGGGVVVRKLSQGDAPVWEGGQLVFVDERLSTVVERANRYSDQKIVLEDAETGEQRISGVFTAGNTAAIVTAITTILPVRASANEGVTHLSMVRKPNASDVGGA